MSLQTELVPPLAAFPREFLAVRAAIASACAYAMPAQPNLEKNAFVRVPASALTRLIPQTWALWLDQEQPDLDLAHNQRIDRGFEDFNTHYSATGGLIYNAGTALGLELTYFAARRGASPDILAIAGNDDRRTFWFAANKILWQRDKVAERMTQALSFARDMLATGRSFWVAGHSTGAVEGTYLIGNLSNQLHLAGGLFFNPVNSRNLRQGVETWAALGAIAPPLHFVTSQPPPGDWGRAYQVDFEKPVTGLWRRLPAVTSTLHFADPSYRLLDGHRLSNSMRALHAYYTAPLPPPR